MRLNFNQLNQAKSGLRDAVLTMLYPSACRVCGVTIESWRDGVACERCWEEAERKFAAGDICVKCGLPLSPLPSFIVTNERRCGRCDALSFGVARACGIYDGAIRESVLWLKHHPQIAPRLRDGLRAAFSNLSVKGEIESIIPVPLHPKRFAERSFNQSEMIARELASFRGLSIDAASLARIKHTEKHRAGMAARERARSLEKAFRVRAPRLIEGRTILLVDDVMTTGSTADTIARTLLDGGASAVHLLTLARAASEFNA